MNQRSLTAPDLYSLHSEKKPQQTIPMPKSPNQHTHLLHPHPLVHLEMINLVQNERKEKVQEIDLRNDKEDPQVEFVRKKEKVNVVVRVKVLEDLEVTRGMVGEKKRRMVRKGLLQRRERKERRNWEIVWGV